MGAKCCFCFPARLMALMGFVILMTAGGFTLVSMEYVKLPAGWNFPADYIKTLRVAEIAFAEKGADIATEAITSSVDVVFNASYYLKLVTKNYVALQWANVVLCSIASLSLFVMALGGNSCAKKVAVFALVKLSVLTLGLAILQWITVYNYAKNKEFGDVVAKIKEIDGTDDLAANIKAVIAEVEKLGDLKDMIMPGYYAVLFLVSLSMIFVVTAIRSYQKKRELERSMENARQRFSFSKV
eukprot:11211_1